MQCSWQALLLTAIIQCSHTSEANFLLVISPQFILSGQNHSSQSDLYSVNQFFVSRKTPLGPWCAVFMLLVSVIAGQTFLGKSPSILTLETRHNPLIGCLGQAQIKIHCHWYLKNKNKKTTILWPELELLTEYLKKMSIRSIRQTAEVFCSDCLMAQSTEFSWNLYRVPTQQLFMMPWGKRIL